MKTHCRCRDCGRRAYLLRSPKEYVIQPACKTCGVRNWRIDKWKNSVQRKLVTCYLVCRHYPHRKGSPQCWFNPDGTDKPTDQLYQELYGDLDEQSSGL